MTCFHWNIDALASLGRIFLRKVMKNMRFADSIVRFGDMGQDIQPNYQVCFSVVVKNSRTQD